MDNNNLFTQRPEPQHYHASNRQDREINQYTARQCQARRKAEDLKLAMELGLHISEIE